MLPALADKTKVMEELERRLAVPPWPDAELWGDPAMAPAPRENIAPMPPPTRRKAPA